MRDLGRVSRQEWRRVLLFAAALMLLTTIPYIVGWLSQGGDWEFGGTLFGVDDGNSYLAKMRLGARGDWLFSIRYTSEPHDGALLFLPYILLGHLSGLFIGASDPSLTQGLAITFHLARIVFGLLLILASYRFVAVFLRRPPSRMLALVLITLGGGLGWLLSLVGLGHLLDSLPVDFFVPEGYSFLILFGLPHLALARSGLLIGLLLLFRALRNPGNFRAWGRDTMLAGLCWVVMGLCVPFYIAVLYVILGVWGLAAWLRTRRFPWALFWRTANAALVALPVLLYTSVVFLSDDVMRDWSAQNQLASPHPLHYVFGYAALATFAIGALRWAWRKGATDHGLPYLLLASWVVVAPVLVYLPINVQRRLAEGVIVPLSILAVAGLRLLFPTRHRMRRARTALLVLTLPTAILLWLGGTFNALSPARPIFHPQAELDALDALEDIAPQDAVVLGVKETGNYLPARTGQIAYVGHGPETIDSNDKTELAEDFFARRLERDEALALLGEVDYVFFGPLEEEHADTPAWDLTTEYPFLVPVYARDGYTIYEVGPRD
ncbi:MAG: hypothetical protein GYB65_23680 [Chloroflexi bacterium]|nr:hypothetical protein [Chloroflexota bacterium]